MKVDTYLMFKSFSVPYYYSIIFGWMPIRIPKNDKDKVCNIIINYGIDTVKTPQFGS